MKRIYMLSAAVAAALGILAGCEKSIQGTPGNTENQEPSQKEIIEISVGIDEISAVSANAAPVYAPVASDANIPELDEAGTKMSLEQGATVKQVKKGWDATDRLLINGNTFTIKSATISEDKHSAIFSGTDPGPNEDGKYVVRLVSPSAVEPDDYNHQTQEEDGDMSHLTYGFTLTVAEEHFGDMVFSPVWAAAHGATFSQSSVMRLRAKLPSGTVASSVKKVIFKANLPVFNGQDSLVVTLTTAGVQSGDQILDVFASLPTGSITPAEDMELLIQFQCHASNNYNKYTYYRVLPKGTPFIVDGAVLFLGNFDCTNIESYANKVVKESDPAVGTETNPYLIGDIHQMQKIKDEISTTMTYYKMVDDISVSGYSGWVPLNKSDTNKFSFDGNNHELKGLTLGAFDDYHSVFGNISGTVENLTLDHITVPAGSNPAGVLASHLGMQNSTSAATVRNITIKNSTIGTSDNKGSSHQGVLAGCIEHAGASISDITISDCTVASTGTAGGMIGNISTYASSTTISGTNEVTNTDVYGGGAGAGGFIGRVQEATDMSGCTYTGGTVYGSARYAGGMVGEASNYTTVITDCHVRNATVDATAVTSTDPRSGGFIGIVYGNVKIKGCTVGTAEQKVTVKFSRSDLLNGGGFAGVHYGTITKDASGNRCKAYVDIVSTGNDAEKALNLGGFVGYHTGLIEYADAVVDMKGSDGENIKGKNIGGFSGRILWQAASGAKPSTKVDNCTVSGTITGGVFTGGFAGLVDSNSGIVVSNNKVNSGTSVTGNGTSSLGGFLGESNPATYSGNTTYANVSGGGSYVGGFVGYANGGNFSNCSARGTVSASGQYVGGFAGISIGSCRYSHCRYWGTSVSTTYNSGDANIGGFCGGITDAFTGLFEQCWVSQGSSGLEVKSTKNRPRVGGFVGTIGSNASSGSGNTGTFHQCRVHKATVTGGQYTGGFVGVSYISMEECCSTGGTSAPVNVNGDSGGGFAGYHQFGTITNCYANSPVKLTAARSNVGGFIGNCKNATVTYSYCTGYVDNPSGTANRGGFIGNTDNITVDYCICSQQTKFIYGTYSHTAVPEQNHRKGDSESDFTVKKWATAYSWAAAIWDLSKDEPALINTETAP